MQEIERKWEVKLIPKNLDSYPHKELVAGYFKDKDGLDTRIRREGDKYFKVKKSGHGVVRDIGPDGDMEITKEEFYSLWPKTIGRRLWKTRFYIPYNGFIIELDIYRDFDDLYTAEVEFKTENNAKSFIPPEWFGRDVTDDKKYSSNNLATHGFDGLGNKYKFDLESGIARVIALVDKILKNGRQSVIIQVAGGSASGKTSAVADKIKSRFGDKAAILSMDDYYRGRSYMDREKERGVILNWDQPEALDLGLLKEHLALLKRETFIDKPVYSFKSGEPIGSEVFRSAKVIILEGLFALNEALVGEGDIRIFVDIGFHGRILRRLLRDVERTGQKPSDILKYFSEIVEPMHEKYVQATKNNADIIINNEYNPEVEAEKSGLHEVQIKFVADIDSESLRKLGADRLGAVVQTDYYYNPKDRNLVDTGEILRIREEGALFILTYKGPKVRSSFRKRPKFEFEITEEVKNKFLALYGNCIKTVKKTRELFQLDGVVFSLDSVYVIDEFRKRVLGNFLEIRSDNKMKNENKIKRVLSKLNLDISQGITESYFEM